MHPSVIVGMPDTEYHQRPELSSTGVRLLLESPAKFKYRQEHPQEPRDEFDVGTAVHTLILGTGAGVMELDFPDFRTKAAQEARDAARAAGMIPMLTKQLAPIQAMADSVLTHPVAGPLLEGGVPEATVFATDPETGVPLRARFDYLHTSRRVVGIDLKTTSGTADPRGFAKAVGNYRYDIQQEHYRHTYTTATGEPVAFLFVVVEKEPPYLVSVVDLPESWAEVGAADAARARAVWRECVDAGVWPGYPTDVQTLTPPAWLIYEESYL